MANFPTTAGQLGAEHLNTYLRTHGCLANGRVTRVDHEVIGTGKMGDNARLTMTYEGEQGDAPATLVAKFPATDEATRAIAGAQGAYYNEVMFYRELAPRTAMRTPAIYASELSEDRTEFMLLMEDMSPAAPGSQLVGESREHCEQVLAEAAKLAAAFYGDESAVDCDYVVTPARDDGGEFGGALMEQSWPGFVDRFGHGLSAEAIAFGERYVRGHLHFVRRFTGPKTIAHGDLRSENILFGPAGATVVDWQTVGESSVLTDAAYFLGGSVATEDRREWERALIADYRDALDRLGVSLSEQDCWEQYREFAMHGILITVLGASFTAAEERSDRMFLAMIQRHLQQCIDLDSGEFLPD
ncbi:MAG: phosphotransferase [Halioglobus sp.]|nr:phosphotransferase [Halioglobus sp.]